MGKFVVLEGLEASGKSTQGRLAVEALSRDGVSSCLTREPTDGPHGREVRRRLADPETDPVSLALAFALDRNEHVNGQDGILKLLAEVDLVVCDRYVLSSIAYQPTQQAIDHDFIASINRHVLVPDLTILISISPETSLKRLIERDGVREIFDHVEIQRQVFANYMDAVSDRRFSSAVAVVDGERDEELVSFDVISAIRRILSE